MFPLLTISLNVFWQILWLLKMSRGPNVFHGLIRVGGPNADASQTGSFLSERGRDC